MDKIMIEISDVLDNLNVLKMHINSIQVQIKCIEKNFNKEIKSLKKNIPANKGIKKPSGFATPTIITTELCEFMNKEDGTKIARTDVTKTLIEYIKTNNLQNNDNKQIIHPDEKLKLLLGIDENEQLTYFTLQKFMNKHFIKKSNTFENEIVL